MLNTLALNKRKAANSEKVPEKKMLSPGGLL